MTVTNSDICDFIQVHVIYSILVWVFFPMGKIRQGAFSSAEI